MGPPLALALRVALADHVVGQLALTLLVALALRVHLALILRLAVVRIMAARAVGQLVSLPT